jgi:hypothetical protein
VTAREQCPHIEHMGCSFCGYCARAVAVGGVRGSGKRRERSEWRVCWRFRARTYEQGMNPSSVFCSSSSAAARLKTEGMCTWRHRVAGRRERKRWRRVVMESSKQVVGFSLGLPDCGDAVWLRSFVYNFVRPFPLARSFLLPSLSSLSIALLSSHPHLALRAPTCPRRSRTGPGKYYCHCPSSH